MTSRIRQRSGRLDILIIAVVALLLVAGMIYVVLQLVGHSEEHVDKVRKTKVAYEESLRWRSENGLGESRIRHDLEQNPNRLKASYPDSALNANCLEMIGRMRRLQELKLTRSTVKSSWLSHITSLPLISLGLSGTPITDKAIKHILKIRSLQSLEIGDTEITDEGLKMLSASGSIQNLSLSVGRRITNDGIKYVSKMPQLRVLELDDAVSLDGKCLAYLRESKHLQYLNLENMKLTREDLQHLTALKHLLLLDLTNCQLDDESFEPITEILTLRVLDIAGNEISDKSLIALSKIPLVRVVLKGCPNVTEGGIAKLQAALPKCKLVYAARTKFAEKMTRAGVNQELKLLEDEAANSLNSQRSR